MTRQDKTTASETPTLDAVRKSLHDTAKIGPARLELEKRRLLASLDDDAIVRQWRFPGIPWRAAVVAATVILALMGVYAWRHLDTSRASIPMPLSGLWRVAPGDITSGRSLRVPPHQGAKMVWPNQTAVWLASMAEVSIEPSDLTTIRFYKGRLLASVTPTPEDHPFTITTALGNVTVHGTAFSVTGDSKHITVRLHKGAVRFEQGGQTIDLHPGFELTTRDGRPPLVRRMHDTGVLADLMIAEKSADLGGPPVPALERRFDMPEMDIVVERTAPAKETPKALRTRPVKITKGPVQEAGTKPSSEGRDELFCDPELETIEVQPASAPEDADPTPAIEALIRKGRYISCIRAVETYLEAHPKGAYVDRAQFLKGYCQTRSGNLKAGRQAFEKYLIRFPEGRYWDRVKDILDE